MAGLSIDAIRTAGWLDRSRLRIYAWIFLGIFTVSAVGWVGMSHGLTDPAGHPLGTDFLGVYAAGLLTNAGTPAAAYDWTQHGAIEQTVIAYDGYFSWQYPPIFLLIATPLARLPYLLALGSYLAVTFAGYLLAVGWLGRPIPNRFLFAAAMPAVFVNFGHGQNGFLTTALLAGGLVLLERKPVVAGILLGLLAYKPQFALLIPVALVAGGHWRTIASACATVVLTVLVAYLAFGSATWLAFLASLEPTRTIILEQGPIGWQKVVSVFSAVRMWGGSISLAYATQTLIVLYAVVLVGLIWRRCPRPQVRIGVLALAVPLTTPYVLDYDLVITGIGVIALAAEGLETGFRPWEKCVLALVVIAPLLARPIGAGLHVPIVPPILIASLAVFALRALLPLRSGSESARGFATLSE